MRYNSVLDYQESGSARTGPGRQGRVAPGKRPATCKLNLEALEDRSLPSSSSLLNGAVGLDGPHAMVRHTEVAAHTGSWRPAASMAEPRAFYSATLLDNGRVLVA